MDTRATLWASPRSSIISKPLRNECQTAGPGGHFPQSSVMPTNPRDAYQTSLLNSRNRRHSEKKSHHPTLYTHTNSSLLTLTQKVTLPACCVALRYTYIRQTTTQPAESNPLFAGEAAGERAIPPTWCSGVSSKSLVPGGVYSCGTVEIMRESARPLRHGTA